MIRNDGVQPNRSVQRQDGTTPVRTTDDPLGSVTGTGNRTGGTQPRSSATNPTDPGHATVLGTATGPSLLSKITDKGEAIARNLDTVLASRLENRLAEAPRSERKAMESVLHYGWGDREGTTKAERLQVRTLVAGYLAQGGGIEGARLLRDLVSRMPDESRARLIDAMKADPDVHIADTLSQQAFLVRDTRQARAKLGTDLTPQEHFATFGRILTDFPPSPDRANTLLCVNDAVSLGFDDDGRLEVRSAAISMVGVKSSTDLPELDQTTRKKIETILTSVASGNYSTQGPVLDFMRFMRETNEQRVEDGETPLSLKQAFAEYKVDGSAITDRFGGGGDCMCHAEKIVSELKKIGIEAKIVGHYTHSLIEMPDPGSVDGSEKIVIPGQDLATESVTHLDVMIPYRQGNEERVLIFNPGMGTKLSATLTDSPATALMTSGQLCYKKVDPNTGEYDPQRAQRSQFAARHNIMLRTTPIDGQDDQKKIVGIDLLAGKLYLNRLASNQFRAGHGDLVKGQEAGAISINFKDALDDPMGEVALKVWNPKTGSYDETKTTKILAFLAIARAVQKEFNQPPSFVQDLLTLAGNYDAYRSDILAKPLTSFNDCQSERKTAIDNRPPEDSPLRARWDMHFEAAAQCLAVGDVETAQKHYQVAAGLGRTGG